MDSKISIYEGIDDIIDDALGLLDIGKSPHYSHKKSALILSKSTPPGFDAFQLFNSIGALFDQ